MRSIVFLSAGGVLVLGLEQDSRGGQFSAAESFVGTLSQFNIWKTVLSHEQVLALHSACQTAGGDLKAWPDFIKGMQGRLTKKDGAFCSGL